MILTFAMPSAAFADGAELEIETLIGKIETVYNLPKGTEVVLVGKLHDALDAVAKGFTDLAIQSLETFVNQVAAQTGKKISVPDATEMIADAKFAIFLLP